METHYFVIVRFANKKKEPIFEQNIVSLINEEDIMDISSMTIREYLVAKVRIEEKKAASRELKKFVQQQQKEFDLLRRQEVDEARRQEREARRQEEEARRQQEEEVRRQEEKARRQEEEARRQEEEARRQEEDKARRKKMILILFKNDFFAEDIEKELSEENEFVQETIEEFIKKTLDKKED
jgi:hypothetical protein